jgi:hypothetical protein
MQCRSVSHHHYTDDVAAYFLFAIARPLEEFVGCLHDTLKWAVIEQLVGLCCEICEYHIIVRLTVQKYIVMVSHFFVCFHGICASHALSQKQKKICQLPLPVSLDPDDFHTQ